MTDAAGNEIRDARIEWLASVSDFIAGRIRHSASFTVRSKS